MKESYSIAHLSDLHLTATDSGRRTEDRARGMNANLSRLLTHRAVQDADLVLITGDVSDRGDQITREHEAGSRLGPGCRTG